MKLSIARLKVVENCSYAFWYATFCHIIFRRHYQNLARCGDLVSPRYVASLVGDKSEIPPRTGIFATPRPGKDGRLRHRSGRSPAPIPPQFMSSRPRYAPGAASFPTLRRGFDSFQARSSPGCGANPAATSEADKPLRQSRPLRQPIIRRTRPTDSSPRRVQ
jgi:hypothetical protein